MGFHDLLILKGIRYDSEEALQLARDLMKFITRVAREESIALGKEKGDFPNKVMSIWKKEKYMRNATVTSIAPTGTISIIADCSSGIEPLFLLVYKRNVQDSMGKSFIEVNSVVKRLLEENGIEADLDSIEEGEELPIPDKLKEVLITAGEIDPIWHVRMQGAFQKYTDNAVSKTVNLPNDATINDIEAVFLEAYNNGCKGITIYRDGSRKEQLLTKIESVDEECKDGVCSL